MVPIFLAIFVNMLINLEKKRNSIDLISFFIFCFFNSEKYKFYNNNFVKNVLQNIINFKIKIVAASKLSWRRQKNDDLG